eukprot:4693938-Amphidinium_carterae.1
MGAQVSLVGSAASPGSSVHNPCCSKEEGHQGGTKLEEELSWAEMRNAARDTQDALSNHSEWQLIPPK